MRKVALGLQAGEDRAQQSQLLQKFMMCWSSAEPPNILTDCHEPLERLVELMHQSNSPTPVELVKIAQVGQKCAACPRLGLGGHSSFWQLQCMFAEPLLHSVCWKTSMNTFGMYSLDPIFLSATETCPQCQESKNVVSKL